MDKPFTCEFESGYDYKRYYGYSQYTNPDELYEALRKYTVAALQTFGVENPRWKDLYNIFFKPVYVNTEKIAKDHGLQFVKYFPLDVFHKAIHIRSIDYNARVYPNI